MNEIETKDIEIPEDKFTNWQNAVNILAEIMGVTSASVTRVYPPELEIMLVNEAKEAEIEAGERFELAGLFCEEVIKSDEKLLVPNALKDERWQDKPGLETGLISYLGFPLKWPDGDFFGTICVHDKEEMEYNPHWEELMKQFKELIESNLELIYQNQKLSNSLDKGFKIHQKLLPNELPDLKGVLGDSYYQPAIKLGGDFYNFILLDDLLIVYLVDVAGHDLDGAITNIFVREAINSFLLFSHSSEEDLSPKEVLLFLVKRYKEEEFPDDQLVSFVMGVLDLEGMDFTFINAGIQIAPLIIDENEGVEFLDCKGVPISSAIEDGIYDILEEKSINFSPGKSVFLTTDGLIEEEKEGEIYGEDRLKKVLMNNRSAPPSLINYQVRKDFKEFAAKTRGQDDITYLSLKRRPPIIERYAFQIESEIDEVMKLKPKLEKVMQSHNLDYVELWLGLKEIICNSLGHGNHWDKDKLIKIKLLLTEDYIEFIVEDEGNGFDWENKLESKKSLLEANERGRGIKIAYIAYDEVWYNEQGNIAHLLKLRD